MNRGWQLGTGLVLTALAGYVDALGFLRLGGLYTSFMSGNTTQFAVYVAEADLNRALMPVALIAGFLAGAILGSVLGILVSPRWATPSILAFETALIVAALAIGLAAHKPSLASPAIAMAMGAQNAVLATVRGFRAGTTFVTGALFSFGQKIAEALTRTGSPLGWLGDGFVWLSLLLGAFCGALAYQTLNLYALVPPAVVAAVFAGITTLLVVRAGPVAKVSR